MTEQPGDARGQTEEIKEQPKKQLERLKEKLTERLAAKELGFGKAAQVRTAIAIAALAGMLLPWLRLDGYNEAMNAADLIAYAFTSPERGAIFGISKLGAIAILFTPSIVLAASVYGLFRIMAGRRQVAAHLVGARAPLGMLMLSRSIVSSDGWDVAGIPLPGFGLIVTVVAQGILLIDTMMEGDD